MPLLDTIMTIDGLDKSIASVGARVHDMDASMQAAYKLRHRVLQDCA